MYAYTYAYTCVQYSKGPDDGQLLGHGRWRTHGSHELALALADVEWYMDSVTIIITHHHRAMMHDDGDNHVPFYICKYQCQLVGSVSSPATVAEQLPIIGAFAVLSS